MTRRFGPVRQIGYVVSDIEKSVRSFIDTLGLGPFFTVPVYPVVDYRFGSIRSSPTVSLAITYSGPLQIELIQPLGDEPSFYGEILADGRPGPHYVTYWVRDLASSVADAEAHGARVVQSGGAEGAGRFAYLREPGGTLFELLESTDMIEAWFGSMQAAAESWDGTDPIRPAMP
jgi:catechol 2,3-dioxygenase-like lactoylglutathione lyase family enzyme